MTKKKRAEAPTKPEYTVVIGLALAVTPTEFNVVFLDLRVEKS
jgi:hypothetical protein